MTYTGETTRLTSPTIRVDYLDDDATWYKRENSARAILRMIFLGVFVFAFSALVITVTVLGVVSLVLESGMRWYMSLAPFILLIVLGYWFRGRRS